MATDEKLIGDFTKAERDIINGAIDKAYKDMTEDELSLIIDWKAAVKAQNDVFQAEMKAIEQANEKRLAIDKAESDLAAEDFDKVIADIEAKIAAREGSNEQA